MENNNKKINIINIYDFIDSHSVSKYYGWNEDYTNQVIYEYDRFMLLRYENQNLSPSDDIDNLWHYHILDTYSYYTYCIKKFGKIIHHNPADSLNQEARKIRLANTHIKYFEKFGNFAFEKVWISTSKSEKPIKFELPKYENNINKKNLIQIFIFYTYDDGYFRPKECNSGIYAGIKKWKPNTNKFDRKIITVKIDSKTNANIIKKYISHITSHPEIAVSIYPNIQNI